MKEHNVILTVRSSRSGRCCLHVLDRTRYSEFIRFTGSEIVYARQLSEQFYGEYVYELRNYSLELAAQHLLEPLGLKQLPIDKRASTLLRTLTKHFNHQSEEDTMTAKKEEPKKTTIAAAAAKKPALVSYDVLGEGTKPKFKGQFTADSKKIDKDLLAKVEKVASPLPEKDAEKAKTKKAIAAPKKEVTALDGRIKVLGTLASREGTKRALLLALLLNSKTTEEARAKCINFNGQKIYVSSIDISFAIQSGLIQVY